MISHIRPSWKQGYARSAGESANPGLWDGVVGACYPSLGPTGLVLRDVSGRHNHGTLTNMDPATDWVMTEKGWALDFDGSDDYVLPAQGLSVGTEFAVSVRLKTTTMATLKTVFGSVDDGGNDIISLHFNANEVDAASVGETFWQVRHTSASTRNVAISANIYDGEWHNIVSTRSGSDTAIWVDGQAQSLTVGTSALVASDPITLQYPMTIGARNLRGVIDRHSVYLLDPLVIWDRSLAPSEIQHLYTDPYAMLRPRSRLSLGTPPLVGGMLNRFGSMKGGISGGRYGVPMTGGMSG